MKLSRPLSMWSKPQDRLCVEVLDAQSVGGPIFDSRSQASLNRFSIQLTASPKTFNSKNPVHLKVHHAAMGKVKAIAHRAPIPATILVLRHVLLVHHVLERGSPPVSPPRPRCRTWAQHHRLASSERRPWPSGMGPSEVERLEPRLRSVPLFFQERTLGHCGPVKIFMRTCMGCKCLTEAI